MKKIFCNKGNNFSFVCGVLLFVILFIICFPSFSYPPLSDDWQLFYFFQHLSDKPGLIKCLHVLNYDPCENMRFQPLSRIFYYVFHLLFGSSFIFFKIFNFLFYFISIILFYKFSLCFVKNKKIAAVFIGVFAVLYSHFDIVLWAHHIYIIFGFGMFLMGFMAHMRFLETRRKTYLLAVIACFLGGLLCYEPFFFWPLGIVFLSCLQRFNRKKLPQKNKVIGKNCLVLGVIYGAYLLFYFYTRSLGTYDSPNHSIYDFLKLKNFAIAGLLVFLNILYNGIFVNIFPLLSFPLKVTENIYMDGVFLRYIENGHGEVMFLGGVLMTIFLFLFFMNLYKRRYYEEMKILGLFFFLLFSKIYIIFFFRLATNEYVYNLTEFRYQYVPNAGIILIILFLVDRFLICSRTRRIITCSLLMGVAIFNIYCVSKVISIYDYHFSPLKKIIFNIKKGIQSKAVNAKYKIHIGDDIQDYLPHLCWNIEMGERFMEGSYEWMFSKKEITCFAENLKEAFWIINKEDFSIMMNDPNNSCENAKKINSIRDKFYVAFRKDKKYLQLGEIYIEQGKYAKAKAMFKKAIEFNPNNEEAYFLIENLYNNKLIYNEIEKTK